MSDDPSRGDAVQRAYEYLVAQIAEGSLEPEARLKESSIADALGISRTPVREALRKLAADGFVEVSRNRGARLASFQESEIAEMYTARVSLEPLTTELAVPRLDQATVGRLDDMALKMVKLANRRKDLRLLNQLNRDFHDVFLEACGNRALASAVLTVSRPTVAQLTMHRYSPAALERSMRHHVEIVDAAKLGDAEWAASVMRTHLLAARHSILGAEE